MHVLQLPMVRFLVHLPFMTTLASSVTSSHCVTPSEYSAFDFAHTDVVTGMDLPDVLLEGVLLYCDIRTVAHAALVSKQFCRVAVSQSLWLRICREEFKETDPTQWLSPQGNLSTYRSVYRLLLSYKPLVGLWSLSKAEKGKLLELYWENDSIAGNQLVYENMR